MYRYVKRLLDFVISFILVIILLIPIFLICIIILLIDNQTPIYIQIRTGKNGKDFKLLKFKSMKNDNITKLGFILRKTSIDELPQLFNILKGDMSFVGPRPWIIDYYKNMNKYQRKRVEVLPGLTGLAQVSGRNNISIFKKIDLDIYYVENYSFKMDFNIFLKTLIVLFKNTDTGNGKGIDKEIKELKKYKGDKNG